MSDQPEAMRLAVVLTRAAQQTCADDNLIVAERWFVEGAAAELRRLHATNENLDFMNEVLHRQIIKLTMAKMELCEVLSPIAAVDLTDSDTKEFPWFVLRARAVLAKHGGKQ